MKIEHQKNLFGGRTFFNRLVDNFGHDLILFPDLYPPQNSRQLEELIHACQHRLLPGIKQDTAIYYMLLSVGNDETHEAANFFADARCLLYRYRIQIQGYFAMDQGNLSQGINLLCYPNVELRWYNEIIDGLLRGQYHSELSKLISVYPLSENIPFEIWNQVSKSILEIDMRNAFDIIVCYISDCF